METSNKQIERRENITYEELIASLQDLFNVDESTVDYLLSTMYREDLTGEKHKKSGTWIFIPFENQEDKKALIKKIPGIII